jgi:hypothetical protein
VGLFKAGQGGEAHAFDFTGRSSSNMLCAIFLGSTG